MSQIGAFQPLRRNRAKYSDRRISWTVSKGRAAVFISYIKAEAFVPGFSQISRFFDFETGSRETARSFNLENNVKTSGRRCFDFTFDLCQRNRGPTLRHYPRYSTISQSRVISSQRLIWRMRAPTHMRLSGTDGLNDSESDIASM